MRWSQMLLAVMLVASTASATPKIVAVFDIENSGASLSKVALERLNTYLATKIAGMGYQVVPRAELRKRLRAQRRESYKACFDQSCQIEIGRELAAQKSVSTKILRLGKDCVVTMALYDLRKSATERAGDATGSCGIGGLVRSIESAAQKLGGVNMGAVRVKIQGVVDREHCPGRGMLRQGDPPPKGNYLWCVDAKTGIRNGLSINWHTNGKRLMAGPYRANKQHGLWTMYHRNGKKRNEVRYRDGKKEGPYIEWNQQGTKFEVGQYKAGKKVGLWTRWLDGKLYRKEHYRNDDLNGVQIVFDTDSGAKRSEFTYRDGQKNGRAVYYRNGVKGSEGIYRDNKREGIWNEYRGGALSERGSYKAGKKHGVWKEFRSGGETAVTYRDDKRNGRYVQRKAGQIAVEGFFANNKRHGTWTTTRGSTVTVQTYSDGKLNGKYEMRRDGQVIVKGRYRDNQRDGIWVHYNTRGGVWTPSREVEWANGKMVTSRRVD